MAEKSLPQALAWIDKNEGPELNISPKEPGGSSQRGVSMETLQHWHRLKGLPPPTLDDMRKVDAALAGAIYTEFYAKPIRFDELPAGVDYRLLDIAVSVGITGSLIVLQRALGRTGVAHYDDALVAIVGAFDPATLIEDLGAEWLAYKMAHGDGEKNGKGWTNRKNEAEGNALSLLLAPAQKPAALAAPIKEITPAPTTKETTMSWRVASSLETLLAMVNKSAPHRRKDSDGSIGDARHQAERTSDHNPYIIVKGVGVVRARDFTHAPETGFDAYAFAEMLRINKDPRIRYIISNYKIASGAAGPQPWVWRKYSCPPNSNPHDHHTHVSVSEDVKLFDDARAWSFAGLDQQIEIAAPEANNYVAPPATLRVGSRGALVKEMQAAIGLAGKDVDGFFGSVVTLPSLKKFQKKNGLGPDGVCGPETWKAIRK